MLRLTLYARRACGETLSKDEIATVSQLDYSDTDLSSEGKTGSEQQSWTDRSGNVDETVVESGSGYVSSNDFIEDDTAAGGDLTFHANSVSSNTTDRYFNERGSSDVDVSVPARRQKEVATTRSDSDLNGFDYHRRTSNGARLPEAKFEDLNSSFSSRIRHSRKAQPRRVDCNR